MSKHFMKWLYVGCLLVIAGCGAAGSGTDVTVNNVGNIVGTVTDAATNDILSGVTVQIGDKTEVTGNNGDYAMQDIAVGSWTVTASKSGYQNHNGTCTVAKGTTDTHNIQMSALTASDTTSPSITSTSPANNATVITINSAISATFTEAMDVSTINSSTFTLSSGGNTVSGTVTYSGTTATFTPLTSLSYSTTYTATVTTGVKDAAGNNIVSAYTWTFTTGALPDTTPPTVSSTSPTNGAAGVAVNIAITATFSENMTAATVTTATFTLTDGINYRAGTVTYSGTTATFTPSSNLAYSTTYTATITTGVKDAADNVMASNYTWSFTTGSAPDTTPPTVSSTSPSSGATGVAVNTAITATFSENMTASTVTTSTFTIAGVIGTVTYTGTTATFTPSNSLAYSTTYTATITTGVKDSAGNAMASSYTWTFRTGSAPDTTVPTVSYTSPSNWATGVVVNTAITATFSETMAASTVNTSTFTLNNGVTGTVTYTGTTATFTPSSNLAYSTTYTGTISTGVKDSAGNAMAAAYTWTFTTGTPDTTPPTVSSTSPANGATGVAVNTAITAAFSETIDASTVTTATFTLNNGVTGTVTYSGTTATFTPSSNLAYSTTYTATIATGVKDSAGNTMAAAYTWTFTTGIAFKMPDTNQTTSYTDTFGEDHDYTINMPSYTNNGNGTITDNVTSLMWQMEDDATQRTWDEATTYCSNLTLDGQTDWRLPSRIELISIVDYGIYYPAINTTYFLNSRPNKYWSSTTFAYNTTSAWNVYFSDGYSISGDKANSFFVRCVRGGQNTPSLTDNGNGTVTDSGNLLTWQQGENSAMTWEAALSYCEGLTLAAQTDWRLPNIKELSSLVDNTRYSPTINTTLFFSAISAYYWSSTTHASYTLSAWRVDFNSGYLYYYDKAFSSSNYVRCVRGGQ